MQYDLHLRRIENEARAEGEKIGRAEGMANAIISNIKSLVKNANYTVEQAMKMLSIPQEDQDFYLAKLQPIS